MADETWWDKTKSTVAKARVPVYATVGGVGGFFVGGPIGAAVGASAGAYVGSKHDESDIRKKDEARREAAAKQVAPPKA